MGSVLSSFFQSGSALLHANNRQLSEQTCSHVQFIFDTLRANPRMSVQRLQPVLSQINKGENILQVHDNEGYNLLQKCVGINNLMMVRWILSRNLDVNRGVCSLPLHIACLKGYEDCVELLLKHGARVDVEARMCWPGQHCHNCEQRAKYGGATAASTSTYSSRAVGERLRVSDRLQSAVYYAIDGDQVEILEMLTQRGDDHWLSWQHRRPLLHIACERGAWGCVQYLVSERSDEINQCFDEYYPIHQAALHHVQFLERLILCGADTTVRTSTQQLSLLHVVFLLAKKSVNDTLLTTKLLLDNGLRELINEPDSLSNTPLHALIVRYALEEARYGYDEEPSPWTKWDTLHLVRFLLQNGAAPSINQPGNSALACVLRHVRDWEFRFELLDMLLQNGGDPNVVGRDGSVPLMVCLVPLINKDPLHHFTHSMKIFYLNCVRLLCRFGANPNCSSRSDLTPLHVLMFTASEHIALSGEPQKTQAFDFVRQLLVILLQYGLDTNARVGRRSQHVLVAVVDMVAVARGASDLARVHQLLLTLVQHGAEPSGAVAGEQLEPKICHSQSSVFLRRAGHTVLYHYVQRLAAREDLLVDDQRRFEMLLRLFYASMQHQPLYACLRLLHAQSQLTPVRWQLAAALRRLQTNPRSLKQLCRQCIYQQLDCRPAVLAAKLPLPPQLKDYLISFAD